MSAFCYERLNGPQQALYRLAREGIFKHAPAVQTQKAQGEDVSAALHALLMDEPALFWFQGRWRFAGDGEDRCLAFEYCMSKAQAEAARKSILETGRQLLASLDRSSARQALFGVYRWLLSNVSYGEGPFKGQTLYDALITRRAVCKGLSKAFQYLTQELHFECILREGTLDGKTRHLWNAVRLEGAWLNVDVSLGYEAFDFMFPKKLQGDPCRCFLVSDKALMQTHRFTESLL